jgi:hypothetical protein
MNEKTRLLLCLQMLMCWKLYSGSVYKDNVLCDVILHLKDKSCRRVCLRSNGSIRFSSVLFWSPFLFSPLLFPLFLVNVMKMGIVITNRRTQKCPHHLFNFETQSLYFHP